MTEEYSLEQCLGLKPIPKAPSRTQQNSTNTADSEAKPLTPAQIQRQQRKDALIRAVFVEGLNFSKACAKVGIDRVTGYKYFYEWKESEEPIKVDRKFWNLIGKLEEENPEKVLDALTRLKIKLTAAKVDVKKEVTATSDVRVKVDAELLEALKDYDRIFNLANNTEGNGGSPAGVEANLPQNSRVEPVDSKASASGDGQVRSN